MSAPDTIASALDRGLAGDTDGALALLQTVADLGPRETAAMLSALAQTAVYKAMRDQEPGTDFGVELARADGTPGGPEEAPPALLFSARFVAAWANRDRATAYALFTAAWERDALGRTNHVGDAIGIVFDMAVHAARELVDEENRQQQNDHGRTR
ncbi:hypothetical protein ABZ312_09830 [Streptomyces sp. NPDC006207]